MWKMRVFYGAQKTRECKKGRNIQMRGVPKAKIMTTSFKQMRWNSWKAVIMIHSQTLLPWISDMIKQTLKSQVWICQPRGVG